MFLPAPFLAAVARSAPFESTLPSMARGPWQARHDFTVAQEWGSEESMVFYLNKPMWAKT